MHRVSLYTDGACRGNPGPGGYGAILTVADAKGHMREKTLSGGFEHTTNNRMELMAVIEGLGMLNKPCYVDVYSDSKYIVDAFNQNWIDSWQSNNWRKKSTKEMVKNQDLWKQLIATMSPHQITWHWVKGHAGHVMNERCDQLATQAADGNDLPYDFGCHEA